jgi:hypothetical protein
MRARAGGELVRKLLSAVLRSDRNVAKLRSVPGKTKATSSGDIGCAIGPTTLYRSNTDNRTGLARDGEHPPVLQLLQTYRHGPAVLYNFDAGGEFCIRKITGRAGFYATLVSRFRRGCSRLIGAHDVLQPASHGPTYG